MGVELSEEQIGRILQRAERSLEPYADASGRMVFRLSAHLVTAMKP